MSLFLSRNSEGPGKARRLGEEQRPSGSPLRRRRSDPLVFASLVLVGGGWLQVQRIAAQRVPVGGVPCALAPAMVQLVTSLERFLPCHLPYDPVGDPFALRRTLVREEQRAKSSTLALLGVTSPRPAMGVVIGDTQPSRQLFEVLLIVPHQV